MKSRLLKDFLLPLSLPLVASLFACSDNGSDNVAGGPGSVTTNGIVAMVGSSPVPNASVALRHVDHRASSASEELFIVGDADAVTDSLGRFELTVPDSGEFRLTVAHDGVAFTKIVSQETYAALDSAGSVPLFATATVTGALDVPAGSKSVWIGVQGTDVLVRSDSNGVFAIPAVPANDTVQLYFMDEAYDSLLGNVPVYLAPYEQVFYNYKSPAAVDSSDTSDVQPEVDTVPKVTALLADGSPAAYATVALRPAKAYAENYLVHNAMVTADLYADENGRFTLPAQDSGEYRLTVTSGNYSYSKVYSADKLTTADTLTLKSSVSHASNITLRSDEEYIWVGVYGMDEVVKTDGNGAYVLPALPAEDSVTVYFVRKDSTEPFMDLKVATTAKSDTVKPSMLLYDFESTNSNWYMSVDTLWKGTTYYTADGKNDSAHQVADHLEMDSTRNSMVFHGKYHLAYEPYAWLLLGTQLQNAMNFSALDSVEFYAKGDGNIRLTLENWAGNDNENKAASDWVALDSTWKRYVFTPADLCINGSEKEDCATSYEAVKGIVKQIHIFPNGGSEFYVDDLKLYGTLF